MNQSDIIFQTFRKSLCYSYDWNNYCKSQEMRKSRRPGFSQITVIKISQY